MKQAKLVKFIRDVLEDYGDLPMIADERAPLDTLYILGPDDGGDYVLKGSVHNINRARDVRNGIFVPEVWSDEATTWS